MEQLHETECEVRSLKTMTQRMVLTHEEMVILNMGQIDNIANDFAIHCTTYSLFKQTIVFPEFKNRKREEVCPSERLKLSYL